MRIEFAIANVKDEFGDFFVAENPRSWILFAVTKTRL